MTGQDEKIQEIVLREKERSLHISRIPKKTKEEFINLSEEDFSSDYGLCLKWCLEQALEYQNAKPILFNQLQSAEKSTALPEESPRSIKMMDGKELQGGKNKNG